jgi:flagellar basal body P-ring formation protein FlgA
MCRTHLKKIQIIIVCLLTGLGGSFNALAKPLTLPEALRVELSEHPSLSGRQFDTQYATPPRPDKCEDWWIEMPVRARMWGALRLQVRCPSNPRLNQQVSLHVMVMAPVLVATKDLVAGHALEPGDWKTMHLDLSKLPTEVIETEQAVQNKELVRNIATGRPLLLNDLRSFTVIKSGDQIKLNFVGTGFSIDASAVAMANAAVGDTVKVRLPDGKVIQGTAVSGGLVEVNMDQR